jgi:hypothetical protein
MKKKPAAPKKAAPAPPPVKAKAKAPATKKGAAPAPPEPVATPAPEPQPVPVVSVLDSIIAAATEKPEAPLGNPQRITIVQNGTVTQVVPPPEPEPPAPEPPKSTKKKCDKPVDPARAEACRRAWIKIRANRAAKAAGLPVPEPRKKSGPKFEADQHYTTLVHKWLGVAAPEGEAPSAVEAPTPVSEQPVTQPVISESVAVKLTKKLRVHLTDGVGPLCGVAPGIAIVTAEYAKVTCKECKKAANKKAKAA